MISNNHSAIEINERLTPVISSNMAWHYRVIPIESDSKTIVFATDRKKYKRKLQIELSILLNRNVQLTEKSKEIIESSLLKFYRKRSKKLDNSNLEKDVVKRILNEANDLGSSDIHIEPDETEVRVRYRIDGKLIHRISFDREEYSALLNRIKIQSHLDISEKRLPQDGRLLLQNAELKTDLRVSTLPTLRGEKIVLRLLDNDASKYNLQKIGMTSEELSFYQSKIQSENGLILLSGPTGSGKTTTLYSTLKHLNDGHRNILTIEDPIEYTLSGINQVQVKPKIGFNFTKALRTFLRQDPDIIMVGEIRDLETAQLAIRAALTGHLVFSTVHTNSAIGTISRLLDMKIEPYLIKSAIRLSIAQRLVRKLCNHCKKESKLDLVELGLDRYSAKPIDAYSALGCEKCHYTGYNGRIAIFEILEPKSEHFNHAKNGNQNLNSSFKTLSQRAFQLLKQGESSLEELYPILIQS